jgi:uncharacterized phage-associated protein
MLIPFDTTKVIQAAAALLKTESSACMSRLRLLKLLYIADREYIQEKARPITGDSVVAMDNGPVLGSVYDMIKGRDAGAVDWQMFLVSNGILVQLKSDPGVGKLSRQEIAKLQDVAGRFRDQDDWDVAEYTHTFEEWQKNKPPKGSSKRIPLDDVLAATGRLDQKASLLEEERRQHRVESFFRNATNAASDPQAAFAKV